MRKPTKRKILLNIIVNGEPSFQEIVSKMDKSPATISWNLSELIRNNVIEKYKKDRTVRYKIKNIGLIKHTFRKEFSKLLYDKKEHSEDIFFGIVILVH